MTNVYSAIRYLEKAIRHYDDGSSISLSCIEHALKYLRATSKATKETK